MNLDLGDTRLILKEAQEKGLSVSHQAYILATAYHETANTMKPVREYGGETYLKTKKYYPWVGRGYVQLTWGYNYKKASAKLGVDLINNPELAMVPVNAAQIIVAGMTEGWFTGKKLSDCSNYRDMRRIVNGTDKADLIAGYAVEYEALLKTVPVITPKSPVESVPASKATTLLDFILNLFRRH